MLTGTDGNNAPFWGWHNKSTVRNVSILLILLCIGLIAILFFLEPTDNDTADNCVDLRKDIENTVILQIGALILTIIGLWTYIWAPFGTGTVNKALMWRVFYIFLAIGELTCLLFVSSFVDEGYTKDEGVIAIWKNCGTNGSIGYGLFIFFAFYIFFVLAYLLVTLFQRAQFFYKVLYKKNDGDYGSGNVASASLV